MTASSSSPSSPSASCCTLAKRDDFAAIEASLRTRGVRPTMRLWPEISRFRLRHHRSICLGLQGRAGPDLPPPPSSPPQAMTFAGPVTFSDRTRVVLDLMLRREWNTKSTARLAAEWSCERRTVRAYASAAVVVLTLDRGDIEQERAISLIQTEAIRDAAIAAGDLKAAVHAQALAAKLSGLLAPVALVARVRRDTAIAMDDVWRRARAALEPFPDALAAMREVMDAFAREMSADPLDAVAIDTTATTAIEAMSDDDEGV